jgi:3-phenylpropionate/trans-cinnamate dioxygenase ferredoxin reductase component
VSPPRRDERGVVIAGGGLAAQRCAETLRRCGYEGRIRIVGDEPLPPYDRPPLSKDVLARTIDPGSLPYRQPNWYAEHQVELLLGRRAVALEPSMQLVQTADGEGLHYEKLLIATGSAPRRLPGAEGFDNVHVLRTIAEARALSAALVPGARLIVVGAGFIGQEVAATARSLGVDVTVVEAAGAPLAAILGEGLGGWFAALHREEGVRMLVSTTVSEFRGRDSVEEIRLGDGRRLPCDVVVLGIGVTPATSWLRRSGLPKDGVPVGPGGQTALPHVYAAGDASLPFDERLQAHVRSEHWESAARTGAEAARAMLGLELRPVSPSSFWSDQYGLRIQYVGHAQGADKIEIDGQLPERDFTAVFSSGGSPVGALLVGRPQELPRLRRLIELGAPVRELVES